MAGSLNHIIGDDGTFTMKFIENLGDAHEALEECYAVIIELSNSDMQKVSAACVKLGLVDPWRIDRYTDEPLPLAMKNTRNSF